VIETAESPEPAPAAPPRWSWPGLLALSGVSLLAGVAVTVAVLLLAGWRHVPVHRYEVVLLLKAQVSTGQREEIAVEVARTFPGDNTVTVTTREEIFEAFRKEWESNGNGTLPGSVTPALSQEHLKVSVSGRGFDCALVRKFQDRGEVDHVSVTRWDGDTGKKSVMGCR
jgi:hypothetical protein